MTFVRSVRVKNLGGTSTPFWPKGGKRLVVVFESPDGRRDMCVAHGLDPDTDQVMFKVNLRPSQRRAFIKAVRDGRNGTKLHDGSDGVAGDGHTAVSNENASVSDQGAAMTATIIPNEDVVVISDPGPGTGPGPKYSVSLSARGSGEVEATIATDPWSRRETLIAPIRRRA